MKKKEKLLEREKSLMKVFRFEKLRLGAECRARLLSKIDKRD